MTWELDFLNFIADNMHGGIWDSIFVFLTHLGDAGIIWIFITILMLLSKKTRVAGIASAISLIFMFISVNVVIKPLFDRVRPFAADTSLLRAVLVELPTDGSFPSGHTAAGFASSTAVFCRNKKLGIFMYILAALIGISRLYLCVHFPTDVIFGALGGIVLGIAGYYISLRITEKNIDKSP